jgi:hypothetical protein
MAYYIFLKSLRCLEEFRKNPHVKIPPKSPSTNFPSLGKFKIQFLIQKSFFFTFGPTTLPRPRPADRPNSPRPKPPAHSVQPASPRASLAYLQKYVFFFDSRLPSSAPFLSPLADTWATAPRAARSAPRMPLSHYRPFPHHSPLNPPSTELLTRLNSFNRHLPPP